jgi:serine kinase of HPr protein (carbohydrate metabolism regulator)
VGHAFAAPENSGILILGECGSGKSTIALQLIERGAVLVADDRIDLFVRDDSLWGRPPANLAGLLEIRGVGIVKLPYAPETPITLAVALGSPGTVPRLPEVLAYSPPKELGLPQNGWPRLFALSASDIAAPARIAAAAAALAHALFREDRNLL